MSDAPGKLISSSNKRFVESPNGKFFSKSWPKNGQEGSVTVSDAKMRPEHPPSGKMEYDTYPAG